MRKIVPLALTLVMLMAGTTGCGLLGGDSIKVSAMFQDSAGLFVGNEVGVLGVKVGEVTKIEPEGQGVRVDMVVDASDVKIPADAQALIVSRSVATDRYVELTPTYSKGAAMKSGAVIPLERTQTPVDFDQVLTALNEFSVGISGNKETAGAIKRFLKVGAETFGPSGDEMNRAITNLSEAVNGISGQKDNIVGTMQSLDVLVSKLVENRAVVQQFLDSVAGTTQLLASEKENFRAAIVTLQQAVAVVAKFAKQNKDKLKSTVADVADVADILLSRQPQLEEFLETMPLVAQNFTRIKDPDGLLLRVPFSTVLGGPVLQQLCQSLGPQLCSLVDGGVVGPLGELLAPILGPILGGL